jgi:anthranilate synthase/aminodeoxychorismate synthase-like glutamine amidotransferase
MILIIDNFDSFTYNLFQMLAAITTDVLVKRNNEITVNEIYNLTPKAILLSPGPGKPEDAGICIDVVKKFSGKIPILGVCLGHQAIGKAFGSKITQAPEIIHGKSTMIYHHQQSIYRHLPLPFQAGRYHSLIIDSPTLPEILQIEAINQNNLVMGIKHRAHPTFGVQFHPESILTPDGKTIIRNFLEYCNGKIIC